MSLTLLVTEMPLIQILTFNFTKLLKEVRGDRAVKPLKLMSCLLNTSKKSSGSIS